MQVLLRSRAREKFESSAICHTRFLNQLSISGIKRCFVWQMIQKFIYVDEKSAIFDPKIVRDFAVSWLFRMAFARLVANGRCPAAEILSGFLSMEHTIRTL